MSGLILTTYFLPAALAVIMLGLGLSLTVADFKRVMQFPRAVVVALSCQMLILPVACYFLAKAFGLPPALAVGLMLLAASPGGAAANLYSHLADGDVALNITLTALNSVLAIVSLPLIVNLSLDLFYGQGQVIPLQFTKVIQVFVIVVGPVGLGMWLRSRYPAFAARMDRPVKWLSIFFLAAVVIMAMAAEWRRLVEYAPLVGLAALSFNLISLAVGYGVPRLLRLSTRQATAISMEIGIHNGTLAIAIAISPLMLNNPTMAMPAAFYGIIAFITAGLFSSLLARRARQAAPVAAAQPTS